VSVKRTLRVGWRKFKALGSPCVSLLRDSVVVALGILIALVVVQVVGL
jgi:hypothetical protein